MAPVGSNLWPVVVPTSNSACASQQCVAQCSSVVPLTHKQPPLENVKNPSADFFCTRVFLSHLKTSI